jgi:CarD family transcriptional regulator
MAKVATKKAIKNQKVQVKSVKAVSVKKSGKKTVLKTVVAKSAAKNTVKTASKAASKGNVKLVQTKKQPVKQEVKQVAKAQPIKSTPPKLSVVAKQPAPAAKLDYDYAVGHYLVYPTHGVGKVVNIETTEIVGTKVTLYVLYFEKEKMTLRVPVSRAAAVGLRKLSSGDQLTKAVTVLKSRPKTARGMWSRRATEYNGKINSGNIEEIAEVVRDLHKNVDDPDRSYSERIIYEQAFDRLAGEFAAINKIDNKEAHERLVKTLGKKAA